MNLVSKLAENKKTSIHATLTFVVLAWLGIVEAQQMPQQCVQSPSRTQPCPNLLYKRSPIDVPSMAIVEGEMLCICLTDFNGLRIQADDAASQQKQQILADKMAANINIPPQTLINLIRN